MSYLSLDKRIALSVNKAEILLAVEDYNCLAINQVIKSLKAQVAELRSLAYEITDKANILSDEVRRRAEKMELRIYATTDDDLK